MGQDESPAPKRHESSVGGVLPVGSSGSGSDRYRAPVERRRCLMLPSMSMCDGPDDVVTSLMVPDADSEDYGSDNWWLNNGVERLRRLPLAKYFEDGVLGRYESVELSEEYAFGVEDYDSQSRHSVPPHQMTSLLCGTLDDALSFFMMEGQLARLVMAEPRHADRLVFFEAWCVAAVRYSGQRAAEQLRTPLDKLRIYSPERAICVKDFRSAPSDMLRTFRKSLAAHFGYLRLWYEAFIAMDCVRQAWSEYSYEDDVCYLHGDVCPEYVPLTCWDDSGWTTDEDSES